jgi:hypothetical protein
MFNRIRTPFVDYLKTARRSHFCSRIHTISSRVSKGVQIHNFKRRMQDIDVYNLFNKQEDEIQHAIAVLKGFSDKQLSELGIPRQNIEFVVRNGRPRLDEDPRNLNLKKRQALAA